MFRKKSAGISHPVVVTSYEVCMRDQYYLAHHSWKFLIVDEGHRIKNLNCKLIRYLLECVCMCVRDIDKAMNG